MKRQKKRANKKETRIEKKVHENEKAKPRKTTVAKKDIVKEKSNDNFDNTMPIMLDEIKQNLEKSVIQDSNIKIEDKKEDNIESIMNTIIDEIVNNKPEDIKEDKDKKQTLETVSTEKETVEEKTQEVIEEKEEFKTQEVKKKAKREKVKIGKTREKKNKKQGKLGTFINSLLFLIFLALFIFSLSKIIIYMKHAKVNKELTKELNQAIVVEVKEDNKPKYQIDFETLKNKNPDTVGFIKVNGTDVNHIVVKGKDNDFYLTRDFDKNYNSAGWIFADYRNSFDHMDRNTIIYGHNMKNGTMFSSLKNILTDEWKNNSENLTVTLVTERKERKYQVFSVYLINNTDDYTKVAFNDYEYTNFIKMIKDRSKYDFNVDVTKDDWILTLSTCGATSNQRIVLHAKEIR